MSNKSKIRWDKIAWKRVIPAAILILLVLYLIISLIVGLFKGGKGNSGTKDNSNGMTICSLNNKQTLQAVNGEDKTHVVVMKDYNFYGENLNIYNGVYDRNNLNTISNIGDSFELVDLCSDKKYSFDIEDKVDGQINLGQLDAGFYAVYIKSGDKISRVYMDRTILTNNTLYTVTRNGTRKKVELLANKTLFDGNKATESLLDQPYLYIRVTEEPASSTETGLDSDYDIVISIAPSLTQDGISLVGEEEWGIVEAKELWDVATELKNKLAEKGIKAKVLKDAYDASFEDGGSFYGINGTVDKAYKSGAKYFIFLDMAVWDGGIGTYYSGFSKGSFAASIHKKLVNIELLRDTQISASEISAGANESLGKFDEEYEIREAGGKVLGAGTYSETSKANESFAANSIYGINTVKIVTNNIKSSGSTDTFKEKKLEIAGAIADGIMEYLTNN